MNLSIVFFCVEESTGIAFASVLFFIIYVRQYVSNDFFFWNLNFM